MRGHQRKRGHGISLGLDLEARLRGVSRGVILSAVGAMLRIVFLVGLVVMRKLGHVILHRLSKITG